MIAISRDLQPRDRPPLHFGYRADQSIDRKRSTHLTINLVPPLCYSSSTRFIFTSLSLSFFLHCTRSFGSFFPPLLFLFIAFFPSPFDCCARGSRKIRVSWTIKIERCRRARINSDSPDDYILHVSPRYLSLNILRNSGERKSGCRSNIRSKLKPVRLEGAGLVHKIPERNAIRLETLSVSKEQNLMPYYRARFNPIHPITTRFNRCYRFNSTTRPRDSTHVLDYLDSPIFP